MVDDVILDAHTGVRGNPRDGRRLNGVGVPESMYLRDFNWDTVIFR